MQKSPSMHKINSQSRKEIVFWLGKRRNIQFSELSRLPQCALSFQNFESFYNIPHTLTKLIQTACLVTYFCAQAVFKVPLSNTFPTHKTIQFKIILVLDVPEGVKLIGLTESFR